MNITILLGSKSDMEHADKIAAFVKEYGVSVEIIVASAHKVPEKVHDHITKLNAIKGPMVLITVVGMSNGLSGVVAGSCVHPVIACPPFKDLDDYSVNIHSTLQMPSEVPVMTVLNPKNAALAALRILAQTNEGLREKLLSRISKIKAEY